MAFQNLASPTTTLIFCFFTFSFYLQQSLRFRVRRGTRWRFCLAGGEESRTCPQIPKALSKDHLSPICSKHSPFRRVWRCVYFGSRIGYRRRCLIGWSSSRSFPQGRCDKLANQLFTSVLYCESVGLFEFGLGSGNCVHVALLATLQQSYLFESKSVGKYLVMGSTASGAMMVAYSLSLDWAGVGLRQRTLRWVCSQGVLQSAWSWRKRGSYGWFAGEGYLKTEALALGCVKARMEGWKSQSLHYGSFTKSDLWLFACSIILYTIHATFIRKQNQVFLPMSHFLTNFYTSFQTSNSQHQRFRFTLINNNSILSAMQGKYHDGRIYQHFVHTYSRVPYLDHQIFNIETSALRESRKANQRALTALQGLERTQLKSEQLTNSIRDSRLKKEQEAKQFMVTLEISQQNQLQREKVGWSQYEKEREEDEVSKLKGQLYLQSLLKSNSTKAESRLSEVRRWI